jgi:two-component system cell cycle response regulator
MQMPNDLRARVNRAWEAQYASPRDSHALAVAVREEALAAGDREVHAWANLTIGYYSLRYVGEAEARAALEAAQQEFRDLGDARGAILSRNGLARVRMMEGDSEGALGMFRANIEEDEGSLSTLDRFYTLNGIAGCLAALGDSPQSLGYLFEALGQLRSINARPQMATLLSNLGAELVAVGDYGEALRVLEEAESLARELEHPRLLVGTTANLTDCLLMLGRNAEALPRARALMDDPESEHVSSPEGNVYSTVAFAFLRTGCHEEAERALVLAEREAERHGGSSRVWAHYLRALQAVQRGQCDVALARLEQARAAFGEHTQLLLQGLVLEALAEHAAAAGRHAEAYALHREFHQVYEQRLGMGTQARYYAVQIRYELNRLRDERDRAREEAVRDPLTGLYNRRYLDSVLSDLVSILARSEQPMAVAMLDLDHFKAVNDACGHPFGDEVLRALARILTDGTRAGDIVCRYGGEEFCLLFPNSTADDAVLRVEVLLERMRATTVQLGPVERTGITFSAGVAGYPEDGVAPADLVEQADRVLYDAKHSGRGVVWHKGKTSGPLGTGEEA